MEKSDLFNIINANALILSISISFLLSLQWWIIWCVKTLYLGLCKMSRHFVVLRAFSWMSGVTTTTVQYYARRRLNFVCVTFRGICCFSRISRLSGVTMTFMTMDHAWCQHVPFSFGEMTRPYWNNFTCEINCPSCCLRPWIRRGWHMFIGTRQWAIECLSAAHSTMCIWKAFINA